MAINEMIAILTFLFLVVQESSGFVGYLAQGNGLNTGATRASDELRDRRSWTNPAASRAVRNKFSGAERWPDRILRNIHGPFHALSNPDSASRPQQPSFGYFHEVESAKISVGQVAGSASAARASSRVYGTELCAVAGGSGGAELTSDAPPSKPKRRGRPRKTAVDTDEQKTKAIATAKRMAAGVASTAPAREERAMTVVAESATLENNVGGISQTGAVMMEETGVVDVLGEGIAEPLVGSTAGSISIIGGDILGGDEVSALLTEEGDQSEWGVGDEEKPTVKARKGRPRGSRGKAKTNGSINGDKELSPDAIDQEEARQDKQAAHIQRQGLKVGAFGKERLVYHNDYVVHEELGFCRYLAPDVTEGSRPDEIMLEFADMNTTIRHDESHLLTRYRAADAARVPLSVVAEQGSWLRHKLKVQERVTKQAINVMDLYAKRARIERDPCLPDGPDMKQFCDGFEHDPTTDQLGSTSKLYVEVVLEKIEDGKLSIEKGVGAVIRYSVITHDKCIPGRYPSRWPQLCRLSYYQS